MVIQLSQVRLYYIDKKDLLRKRQRRPGRKTISGTKRKLRLLYRRLSGIRVHQDRCQFATLQDQKAVFTDSAVLERKLPEIFLIQKLVFNQLQSPDIKEPLVWS